MTASHIAQLAGTIAAQADAIEQGAVIGTLPAAVQRLADNVELLKTWVEAEEAPPTITSSGPRSGKTFKALAEVRRLANKPGIDLRIEEP